MANQREKILFFAVRTARGTNTTMATIAITVKFVKANNGPAAKAATAPERFASASTPPCADARPSIGIAPLNMAEAATFTKDQPTPNKISETTTQFVE